jgi:CRP/FNR family transcriptional regulator, cyclic AMP receptor protein
VALDADTLRKVPLFSSLTDDDLESLVPMFNERSFTVGHEITKERQPGFGFFVIESGTAKVTVHGEEKHTLGPGDYFGEIALLDPGPRLATITTDSPLVAHHLSATEFRQLVQGNAELSWSLLEGLTRIMRENAPDED